MGPRGLVQKLDQLWHKRQSLPRGARLLVAVSGGADSVALLRLLVEINCSRYWNWTLTVAHVSHGIRGRAGAADARFVKTLAAQHHLPHAQKSLRLGASASEATARAARYKALASLALSHQAAGVVLAHHADDQAETLLLRALRGTGIEGLGAMAPQSTRGGLTLWRPLLDVRREDLRTYLRARDQAWCEDETNGADRYTRNRLRRDVLPGLHAINPDAVGALGNLAALARETWEVVGVAAADAWHSAVVAHSPRRVVFARAALRALPPLLCAELLRRAIDDVGGSREIAGFERLQEAVRSVRGRDGGKQLDMGRGVLLRVGREVSVEK